MGGDGFVLGPIRNGNKTLVAWMGFGDITGYARHHGSLAAERMASIR
jgi:hypothetical protein